MHQNKTLLKRALISVSDKTGIIEFAHALHELQIEIVATGGTKTLLQMANIPVIEVADVTGFPEMMDGRVKTLHPCIHGAILGLRDQHADMAALHQLQWIDLVIVNLYPFAATIQQPNVSFDAAIENIDIGGPTMLRSAAKNMGWVGVVVDPKDYAGVIAELKKNQGLSFLTRKQLATKAFAHTAQYDAMITEYLTATPQYKNLYLEKFADLRYGENPHQPALAYRFQHENKGILSSKQYQGKQLSYNNINDADAAFACVREFLTPTCVIVKHANPCGVASSETIAEAFSRAFSADSLSAFGGVVAINQPCTKELAEQLTHFFVEVIIAPAYREEALTILARKPNLRVLELSLNAMDTTEELKFVTGAVLIQNKDDHRLVKENWQVVTQRQPQSEELPTLLFAWQVLKYIKSNAILIAKEQRTVGIGAGQVSRVDAVDIAIKKAGTDLRGTILASDAFFPFPDSIEQIAKTPIKTIIQPGGSLRDAEVIAACDQYGIAMVFTGVRCFKH